MGIAGIENDDAAIGRLASLILLAGGEPLSEKRKTAPHTSRKAVRFKRRKNKRASESSLEAESYTKGNIHAAKTNC